MRRDGALACIGKPLKKPCPSVLETARTLLFYWLPFLEPMALMRSRYISFLVLTVKDTDMLS